MAEESSLNAQILEAVRTVQSFVQGAAPEVASAVTRQQVAAALGLAVQNAVAHLQSLQTLNVAFTAQTLSTSLDGGETARAQEIMQSALRSALDQIGELTRLALSVQEDRTEG